LLPRCAVARSDRQQRRQSKPAQPPGRAGAYGHRHRRTLPVIRISDPQPLAVAVRHQVFATRSGQDSYSRWVNDLPAAAMSGRAEMSGRHKRTSDPVGTSSMLSSAGTWTSASAAVRAVLRALDPDLRGEPPVAGSFAPFSSDESRGGPRSIRQTAPSHSNREAS
jgi:hypothetical protein